MIHLTEEQKENAINKMKIAYDEKIRYMGAQDDDTLFSWKNENLKIHIINTYPNSNVLLIPGTFFVFAEKNFKNDINFQDLLKETHNYSFENLKTSQAILDYFIQNKLVRVSSPIINFSIINSGFHFSGETIKYFNEVVTDIGERFAENEYKQRNKKLSNTIINPKITLFNKSYYANRYHFKQILESINDQQFAAELNDCLAAYESGLWFVCAAGLGGVIEHLLYMSLKRLDDHYRESRSDDECKRNSPLKGLRNDPMKTDYIKKLKQFHPSFDSRTENHINSVFLLRNSIDHYNSGYSNKSICDLMLQGVADIYGNIYINS